MDIKVDKINVFGMEPIKHVTIGDSVNGKMEFNVTDKAFEEIATAFYNIVSANAQQTNAQQTNASEG